MPDSVTISHVGVPVAKERGFLGRSCADDAAIIRVLTEILFPQSDWVKSGVFVGNPDSKARPRLGKGRVYSPSAKAETALAWEMRTVFPEKLVGNIGVACVFFRSNRQRIDADNMLKHVMDAATGVIWKDDSQVTAQAGFVEYDPAAPRTIIAIGQHNSSLTREVPAERVCAKCGGLFRPHWHGSEAKFCSRGCAARSRGQDLREQVRCGQCGTEFRRHVAGQRYCSDKCRLDYLHNLTRSKTVPKPMCRICGEKLSRHGYALCRPCWRTARWA
jgi:Holliday junction resolvase RusA-like endonuclease